MEPDFEGLNLSTLLMAYLICVNSPRTKQVTLSIINNIIRQFMNSETALTTPIFTSREQADPKQNKSMTLSLRIRNTFRAKKSDVRAGPLQSLHPK